MMISYFDTVTSTNDIAKALAKNGATEGTVIVANHQSAGRGRMGKSFMSPEGTGLYMSVILRPKFPPESSLLITTAAAAAVAKTIEKYTTVKPQIKWVNDVYMRGKKVCGILTEGQIRGDNLEFAILGIGVNLMAPQGGFGELETIAGAVFEDDDIDKEVFLKEILNAFFAYYKNLEEKPHYHDYVSRDMLCGKKVSVIQGGKELYTATVCGIERDFSLTVEHGGKKENLASGEVSVKI
ncbi:MAG: biotin--[acetyl-CoA-carboxylase] ligase [Ruminococcaceae bacterium]|nr:biotin--[acetyl-CoA-carboxylase] ligase [Oscillospiraceae bacterium]